MVSRCTALLLSLAFAGAPVLADFCTLSCEAAHTHDAAAVSPHAGHHHESTALFTISQPPQPCGHDHDGIVAVAASSNGARTRPVAMMSAGVLPASLLATPVWRSISDLHSANSPPGTALRGFTSPIRV